MTKQKWLEVFDDENDRLIGDLTTTDIEPENWEKIRTAVLSWVDAVDQVTETYLDESGKTSEETVQ